MIISITANTSWYLYNFRRNTILALIKEGHKVVAIAPDTEYEEKLERIGCKCVQIKMQRSGKNPFYDLKTLWGFYRAFKKEKVEVSLNFTPKNNIYATLAASYSNVRTINNIAGLGVVFINKNIFSKIISLLYKYSQRKADFVFFQNEEDKSLFMDLGITTSDKCDRLPGSGVDLARFEYLPKVPKSTIRFLLVARLISEKGIYVYVEASRKLKESFSGLEFCILGPIDLNSKSAIKESELKMWEDEGLINYLGFTDRVEEELINADCIVLPSFYREGVPKSLLEAAAIGRPIITTRNVGCREVVDDEFNGYLCEPRSSVSLIESLTKFIKLTSDEKIQMGYKSRLKVQRDFDEVIVINKYLAAINRVTGNVN